MKTWEELQMRDQAELDALITTRDLLRKHEAANARLFALLKAKGVELSDSVLAQSYPVDGLGVFNMSQTAVTYGEQYLTDVLGTETHDVPYECGTVACIGGWCSLIQQGAVSLDSRKPVKMTKKMSDIADEYVCAFSENDDGNLERSGPLRKLFYPDVDYAHWKNITPGYAAQAIDNLLEYGNPRWDDVLDVELREDD